MAETPEDLDQAATGNGYDPDQTWDDEPTQDDDGTGPDTDRNPGPPIEEDNQ